MRRLLPLLMLGLLSCITTRQMDFMSKHDPAYSRVKQITRSPEWRKMFAELYPLAYPYIPPIAGNIARKKYFARHATSALAPIIRMAPDLPDSVILGLTYLYVHSELAKCMGYPVDMDVIDSLLFEDIELWRSQLKKDDP